jgi:hypothetical protein
MLQKSDRSERVLQLLMINELLRKLHVARHGERQ